ncbi:hypothetical protein [Marivirga arenosa]|jgi:hypothetical protein|uniref:Uncharacterized protein n=1 Tax=Marivirga arenosa TaxID=3059076 RepID=A0AA49GEZ4_9BACT|nr:MULTISPECIES: hypothetical protein [unclassified Marivirga]WKK81969.1 hypothetical protein QYS47_07305 [Marivirga sp. BKB1-2]WKK87330.1 hypothetical protein QYS48_11455 [Marivirga sp. ABR2-2]
MDLSKNAIVDLLNHTIKESRDVSWKMGAGYHNGTDVSIYEVLIYEIKNNKTIGRFAFNGKSGELINQRIVGYRQKAADNIIDALLDVSNYLKSKFLN